MLFSRELSGKWLFVISSEVRDQRLEVRGQGGKVVWNLELVIWYFIRMLHFREKYCLQMEIVLKGVLQLLMGITVYNFCYKK